MYSTSAAAMVNNTPVDANQAYVTWNEGKHVTFFAAQFQPGQRHRERSDTATVSVTVATLTCLKDDSNGNLLKINLITGEYFFRISTGTVYHNFAVITKVNNAYSFYSVKADLNFLQGTIQQGMANAWLQVPRKGKKPAAEPRNINSPWR